MGLFGKLKQSLSKTKEAISGRIESVLKVFRAVDEDLLEELEEILIMADLGVETSMEIIDRLRDAIKEKHIPTSSRLNRNLKTFSQKFLPRARLLLNFMAHLR